MSICVEIEVDDNGQVTVGVCPPEEEAGESKDYMQPAESVEVALEKAKSLLSAKGAPAAPAAPAKPASMQEAMFGPEKTEQEA
jgi:hypothetical protein